MKKWLIIVMLIGMIFSVFSQEIKLVVNKTVAIECPTEEIAKELMEICEKARFVWWFSQEDATEGFFLYKKKTLWSVYKSNTCICLDSDSTISYTSRKFCLSNQYRMLTFEEFLLEQNIIKFFQTKIPE